MDRLVVKARQALRSGDPGRAAALASESLRRDARSGAAWSVAADALAAVLRQAGLLGHGYAPGSVPPRVLRESPSAPALAELAGELQRALHALVGLGEAAAARRIFELGAALCDLDLVRAPAGGSPTGRVVSILCCDRADLLARTIRDLTASDLPPSDLVLFDDASTDPRVAQILASEAFGRHRVHVLRNRGFRTRCWGGNQNAVLDYAERFLGGFEELILLDSDMALAPDWWSAQRRVAEALAPLELPEGRLGGVTAFHAARSHPAVRTVDAGGVRARIKRSVGGCLLAVDRATYREVLGPFDHLADWGWCLRLRLARRFVAATVPSRAQHLGRESLLFHAVSDSAPDFEA
ncbi:MAG: glycosyltransferase family 2 protein [Acidobacteria bacterium]|nr:MAG: glycosyltransferase family 2 protein [Acidobacteriota bacterium]